MPEYKEEEKEVEIPKGAGITGYLKAIETILQLPRVQEISIRTQGRVSYRRYVRPDEPETPLSVDLESLMPWMILRNLPMEELMVRDDGNAAVAVSQMFAALTRDGLNPVAFSGHSQSYFWLWHGVTTKVALSTTRDEAYGLPYYPDDNIPKEVLLICGAYGRGASLVDTRKSYKITIPWRPHANGR
jgi:hypothetical protein